MIYAERVIICFMEVESLGLNLQLRRLLEGPKQVVDNTYNFLEWSLYTDEVTRSQIFSV